MKLYLASFLEPENFGPGRVIGIANGSKPEHVFCNSVFPPLIPSNKIMENYNRMSIDNRKTAGKEFVTSFTEQLDDFKQKVLTKAKEEDKSVAEVLPFKDGDTLASWEREAFTNYRDLVSKCLEELGYEVELH